MPPSESTQIPEELMALAPYDLPNYRQERRDWLDVGVSIQHIPKALRPAIMSLYDAVHGIAAMKRQSAEASDIRQQILLEFDWGNLARQAENLAAHCDQAEGPAADTLRDLGHGSINVLFGLVQLMEAIPGDLSLVDKCCSASRDTAKIMRLLVSDLDPETRDRDEANKPHEIEHFVEKWKGMQIATSKGKVDVELICTFRGNISARCLETSTIDRMTYTLVDNASRFSADDSIRLYIFPVSSSNTRWVVQYTPTDLGRNSSLEFDNDLQGRFRRCIERNEYGSGLQTVAQLVSDCYGLDEIGEALDRGYVGGKLLPSGATLWFHWPSN